MTLARARVASEGAVPADEDGQLSLVLSVNGRSQRVKARATHSAKGNEPHA